MSRFRELLAFLDFNNTQQGDHRDFDGEKQEKDWIELLFDLIAKKDSQFFSAAA